MTQYAIVTDLNRCVGCMSCSAACKMINDVPIGSFWTKILRIGPNPKFEGAKAPNMEMYFLPVQCQHCENPLCVQVCPTGASAKEADGTIQVDKQKCIGCQFCVMACPYNVRYLNESEGVVEKCTLCQQQITQGDLPQCVITCVGRAKWFGDIEKGIDQMVALPNFYHLDGKTAYDDIRASRVTLGEYCEDYNESQVYSLPDLGNKPSFRYILRNRKWRG